MDVRRLAALLVGAIVATAVAAQAQASISGQTRHLKFSATVSPLRVVPGERLVLAVEVTPKRGMHVYAPSSKYRPIAIALKPQKSFTVGEVVYPPPDRYYFKPLNETVDVFQKPFRLTVELRAVEGAAAVSPTLAGTLEYQACDDHVCYLPESIPFQMRLTSR